MRLCKPSFQSITLSQTNIENIESETSNPLTGFGVTELLTLPNSFGNIYLGETFTSYISIHNHTPFDARNVIVKAELQTGTQRFNLLDISASPISLFASGENHDYLVHHEIKEGGIHILVCTVNYTKHDGEKKYFRKFFRFQVMNPIAIKPQTYDIQNGIFLTAQVKNTAQSPLFLETVKFESIPLFTVIDQNNNSNTINDLAYIKPGEVRQYLYKLEPKTANDSRVKSTSTIGKLDILWRGNLGEIGRLQTSSIERKLSAPVDIELNIRKIPPHIVIEQPFIVTCEIHNRSDRQITPRIEYIKTLMVGIIANGISGQVMGKIEPGGTQSLQISLFAVKPGVHKISGLRIIDESSQKNYDFNDIIDVLVTTNETELL